MIAVALTSQEQKAGFPLTLKLPNNKYWKPSWVKISQIRTLSVERLGKKIGQVSPDILEQVVDGLNEIIN